MRKIFKGEDPTCLDSAERNGWTWDEFVAKDHDYATSGEIEPMSGLSEESFEKAEETIRVFNLNEAELVNRRRTMMAQIVCYQDLSEEDIRSSFDGMGFLSVVEQEIGYMFA